MKNRNILQYLKGFEDVRYYEYPFPAGSLYIFGDNSSLKLVCFGYSLADRGEIERHFKSSVSGVIENAVQFLDRYLLGEDGRVPELNLDLFTENERRVYKSLQNVPFGKTVSYKGLADKAGLSGGARFVGNTMAMNIFPVIIPCHRVVKADGSIGNYSGGKSIKKFLLEHERVMSEGKLL